MNKGIRFFIVIALFMLFGFSIASCKNNVISTKPWYETTWFNDTIEISFYDNSTFLLKKDGVNYLKGNYNFYDYMINLSSLQRWESSYWALEPSGYNNGFLSYTSNSSKTGLYINKLSTSNTKLYSIASDLFSSFTR